MDASHSSRKNQREFLRRAILSLRDSRRKCKMRKDVLKIAEARKKTRLVESAQVFAFGRRAARCVLAKTHFAVVWSTETRSELQSRENEAQMSSNANAYVRAIEQAKRAPKTSPSRLRAKSN